MAQAAPPPNNEARTFLAWVFSSLLIIGGAAFLLISGGVVPYSGPLETLLAVGVALLSAPFIIRYIVNRHEWWMLVTGYVFATVAVLLVMMLFNLSHDQFIGMVALAASGLPLLVMYANRRDRWGLLILGYIPVLAAILLGLTIFSLTQQMLLAFTILLASIPFWIIYQHDRLKWTSLAIAGLLSIAGVGLLAFFLLVDIFRSSDQAASGVIYIAFAVIFAAVWYFIRQFDWALWLAAGFVLAAVASVFLTSSGASLAVVALTLGLYIAFRQLDPKMTAAAQQAQQKQQAKAAQKAAQSQPAASTSPPQSSAPPKAPGAQATAPTSSAQPIQPVVPANEEAPPISGQPSGADQRAVKHFKPLDPFSVSGSRDDDEGSPD